MVLPGLWNRIRGLFILKTKTKLGTQLKMLFDLIFFFPDDSFLSQVSGSRKKEVIFFSLTE